MRMRFSSLVALTLASAPGAAWAAGGGGLGDLMSLAPGSMLWTLLTFFILLLVLWKFAWGPIVKGLEAREEKIQGAIEQAQKDREEAAAKLQEYEAKLSDMATEVNERLSRADKEAQARIDQAVNEAREEREKMINRAEQEVQAIRDNVKAELRAEMVDIAARVAAAAIQDSFDREDQIKIIEQRLKNVEAQS
ncbi:F0F1 ATP synthase subunit B [bacterium]|nr:F0F1 ATP synthase subunit B [bacterium]